MPAWKKRMRNSEFSHSPSGVDSFASGPAIFTTVAVQSGFSAGPVITCSRCSARVGASHRNTPATARLMATKMSVLNINMILLLDPDPDDFSHDHGTYQHHRQQDLEHGDPDGVRPQGAHEAWVGQVHDARQKERHEAEDPGRHASLGGEHPDLGQQSEPLANQLAQVAQDLREVAP